MKSEPTISIQKFVSEMSRIYTSSKQTIKHRANLSQNLLGSSGDWEVRGLLNKFPDFFSYGLFYFFFTHMKL